MDGITATEAVGIGRFQAPVKREGENKPVPQDVDRSRAHAGGVQTQMTKPTPWKNQHCRCALFFASHLFQAEIVPAASPGQIPGSTHGGIRVPGPPETRRPLPPWAWLESVASVNDLVRNPQ